MPIPIRQNLRMAAYLMRQRLAKREKYPLIVELDQRLADLDPGYHVHQVKEKYGTLSYYVQGAPFVAAAMEALVEQAEAESARICEQCGGEGVLMEDCGWYATRCRACTRGSRYRPAER